MQKTTQQGHSFFSPAILSAVKTFSLGVKLMDKVYIAREPEELRTLLKELIIHAARADQVESKLLRNAPNIC